MQYKINISGMHCKGCANLIKMFMEEEELKDVSVDLKKNSAVFVTDLEPENTQAKLDKTFSQFTDYKYTSLIITNGKN